MATRMMVTLLHLSIGIGIFQMNIPITANVMRLIYNILGNLKIVGFQALPRSLKDLLILKIWLN